MSKQELIDLCEKRIEDIEEKIKELDSDNEYKYYENFFKLYGIKTLKGISKINPTDTAIVFAHNDIKDKKFSEIAEDIISFKYILEEFDYDELEDLRFTMNCLKYSDALEDLMDFFSSNIINFHIPFGKSMDKEKRKIVSSIIQTLANMRADEKAHICKFFEYWEIYSETMNKIITYIADTKKVRALFLEDSHTIYDLDSDRQVVLSGKELDHFHNKVAKVIFSYKEAASQYNPVEEHYNKLLSDYKTKMRGFTKHKKVYTEFISKLQKGFKPGEIKDYQSAIKNIPDEDKKVREGFLKLVYEHNMGVFTETKKTYDSLVENSSDRFIALLQDNGISIEGVQIESIAKNSYDDVVTMIKILKGMFKDNDTIVKGLEIATLADVLYLKELIENGVLSIDSVIADTSLFSSESDARKVLDENIKTLNEFGFNPSILGLNQGLLLGCKSLENGLNVLREYDLIKYIKGQNDYSFLGSSDLTTKIDKFLELGYEEFVKEDITLLNEDNIDRVYVLKSIGAMPKTKEELLDCLRSDKFLISDDKREEYIHSVVPYIDIDFKLDIDSIIADYDNTNRTICINGVILSKNRIRRNSDLGSFKSIITGSILSMDEVDSLKSELGKKELIKNS